MALTQGQKVLVGGLVVGAFGWGWAKSRAVSRRAYAGQPPATKAAAQEAAMGLGNLAQTIVLGPVLEEWAFRGQLMGAMKAAGLPMGIAGLASAAVFGAAHGGKGDSKVVDVRLDAKTQQIDAAVGGALYGLAFVVGGLPAAVIAHGAHNLGTVVGWVEGINRAP